MLQPEVNRVVYAAGERQVVVERLQPKGLRRLDVLGLMALEQAAYQVQFGREQDFDPSSIPDFQIKDEILRLREEQSEGHKLWIVRGKNDLFDGYIDVGPRGRRTHLHHVYVRPPFHRGLGSHLLHAALTSDVWPLGGQFSLTGIRGSSANHFYTSLGMIPIEDEKNESFMRYITPKGFGLQGVIQALETRRPELVQAQRR